MTHQILVFSDTGHYLGTIDTATSLRYTNVVNGRGYFELTAAAAAVPEAWLAPDTQVHFWRRSDYVPWRLDFVGLLRDHTTDTRGGLTTVTVSGYGINDLIGRRIVAYPAGSAEAEKDEPINDMIRALARENFGGMAAAERRYAPALDFTVNPDNDGLGVSTKRGFAYKNVLETMQGLSQLNIALGGDEIYFGIACLGYNDYRPEFWFGTSVGVRPERDIAETMIFSEANGGIMDASLQLSRGEAKNAIYAGGLGHEGDRNVVLVTDDDAIALSAIGRVEAFTYATHVADDEVAGVAETALRKYRATRSLRCTLADTPNTPYGRWQCGDRVTVEYRGEVTADVVRMVDVSVNSSGFEIIRAQFGQGPDPTDTTAMLVREIDHIEEVVASLGVAEMAKFAGSQAGPLTLSELPREGMFGVDTANNRLYINVAGVPRWVTLA